MSRRLIIPSSSSSSPGQNDEMRDLALQLLLLSKVFDQTFSSLTTYITSLENRVISLSKKIVSIKSETKNNSNNRSRSRSYSNVRGGGTGQSMDKSICLSTFGSNLTADHDSSYRIFSSVRPVWIHELYNAEYMHRMPPLHLLDEYLDPAILTRLGSCTKCYSNPDFFIERWQSQQEARVAELQREKKARKAERKERKLKQEEKKRNMVRTNASTVEEGKVAKESGGIVSSAGASSVVPPAALNPMSTGSNTLPVVDVNHTSSSSSSSSSSTTTPAQMPPPLSSSTMIPLPPKPKPAVMTSTDISNDSRRHRYIDPGYYSVHPHRTTTLHCTTFICCDGTSNIY